MLLENGTARSTSQALARSLKPKKGVSTHCNLIYPKPNNTELRENIPSLNARSSHGLTSFRKSNNISKIRMTCWVNHGRLELASGWLNMLARHRPAVAVGWVRHAFSFEVPIRVFLHLSFNALLLLL